MPPRRQSRLTSVMDVRAALVNEGTSTFRGNIVRDNGRGHFGDHYGNIYITEVHHHHESIHRAVFDRSRDHLLMARADLEATSPTGIFNVNSDDQLLSGLPEADMGPSTTCSRLDDPSHTDSSQPGSRLPSMMFFDSDRTRKSATQLFTAIQDNFETCCGLQHRAGLCLELSPPGQRATAKEQRALRPILILTHDPSPGDALRPCIVTAAEDPDHKVEESTTDYASRTETRPRQFEGTRLKRRAQAACLDVALHQDQSVSKVRAVKRLKRPSQSPTLLEDIRSWCKMHDGGLSCFLSDASDRNREEPQNSIVFRPTQVTLAEVIADRSDYRLSILRRRQLALSLAMGVLNLYNTPWLGDQWSRRDIVFSMSSDGHLGSDPFFLAPVEAPRNGARCVPKHKHILDSKLFSLGLVFIELALETPFETLKISDDGGDDPQSSDSAAAVRLIQEVECESGFRYADVVRRSIESDHYDSERFTDVDFWEGVLKFVIATLEQELSYLGPI